MAEKKDIGALWINEGKAGKFLAGNITIDGVTTSIVVFKNDYKKADNHPDYRIFLSNKQAVNSPAAEATEAAEEDPMPF